MIELKRGENADVILNNLYKQTQMQDTFGMNMVALIDGQPSLLNLQAKCSTRSCAIAAKSSRAARYSNCARRANAAISSKVWRWRCPMWTRSSR